MKQSLMAATASFAHLLGRGTTAAAAAPDDDPDLPRHDGESDDDYDKRRSAAEDEDKKRDGESDDDHAARVKGNKAKRAEKTAPDDNTEDDKGDDESDGGDMKKQGIAATRRRERARCAAIFTDPAAGKNPALAAVLAFTTDLPRTQAIAVLRTGGAAIAGPRLALDARMAAARIPPIDAGGGTQPGPSGQSKPYTDATAVIVAGMKRRGDSDEDIAAFETRRRATAA